MESPRRNLPTAARRYFYRLVFFYIGCVLAIGILSPYNDPKLTNGGAGAGSSAFVVGITNAGIPILDSIINGGECLDSLWCAMVGSRGVGIIISAWSSGNSFLYLSSRSLYSLAVTGNAPRVFKGMSDHPWFCYCSRSFSLQSMGRSLLGCHCQFSLCWTRVSQCVQFGFCCLQLVCELDEYIRLH